MALRIRTLKGVVMSGWEIFWNVVIFIALISRAKKFDELLFGKAPFHLGIKKLVQVRRMANAATLTEYIWLLFVYGVVAYILYFHRWWSAFGLVIAEGAVAIFTIYYAKKWVTHYKAIGEL